MTEEMPPELDEGLIDDVRALLHAFTSAAARQLQVRLRDGVRLELRREARPPSGTPVYAPHVCTLISVVAADGHVSTSEPVATVHLLDEEITLTAPCDGFVEAADVEPGDLLDFGAVVVSVRPSAD